MLTDKYRTEGYHDKIKYEFVGTAGINYIDFRTAQPAGENGIVQFLTPDLYIVFHDLKNKVGMFNIATYLLGKEKKSRFKQEYAVRFNHERVKEAFRDPNTFVFFSESEAADLKKLFEEEHFMSAKIGVFSRKNGGNLLQFDEDEYEKVVDFLRKYEIMRIVPGSNRTQFSDQFLREEAYNEGYVKGKKENSPYGKESYLTRRKVKRTAFLTTLTFSASAVLQVVGKKMIGKGIPLTIIGAILYAAGAIGNMIAFNIGNTLVNKFNDEVIWG